MERVLNWNDLPPTPAPATKGAPKLDDVGRGAADRLERLGRRLAVHVDARDRARAPSKTTFSVSER
jgi:hypothetical protein